ncbi:hypothetical protein AMECASPLE_014886, partial [Ameca splendens]
KFHEQRETWRASAAKAEERREEDKAKSVQRAVIASLLKSKSPSVSINSQKLSQQRCTHTVKNAHNERQNRESEMTLRASTVMTSLITILFENNQPLASVMTNYL